MPTSILIADTDIVLLELLRSRCECMGLNVLTSTRGEDVVPAFKHAQPDLVCISDELKCRDGQTACDLLAQISRASQSRVIVLTRDQAHRKEISGRELHAYVVQRSGNLWHRLEPLIYELIEDLHRAPRDRQLPARFSTPHDSALDRADEAADARDEVLDAVFAWFGEAEATSAAPSAPSHLRGPHSRLRECAEPPWVLCIEDDQDFSLVLKLRLESRGVAVVRAFDGRDGYRTAFTHPARAIILDYNLPQGQGDYVLRRLKENPVTAGVPVIVLTGNRSATIKRQMLSLGAAAYLTKPLDFEELSAVLGEYVDLLPHGYASVAD